MDDQSKVAGCPDGASFSIPSCLYRISLPDLVDVVLPKDYIDSLQFPYGPVLCWSLPECIQFRVVNQRVAGWEGNLLCQHVEDKHSSSEAIIGQACATMQLNSGLVCCVQRRASSQRIDRQVSGVETEVKFLGNRSPTHGNLCSSIDKNPDSSPPATLSGINCHRDEGREDSVPSLFVVLRPAALALASTSCGSASSSASEERRGSFGLLLSLFLAWGRGAAAPVALLG